VGLHENEKDEDERSWAVQEGKKWRCKDERRRRREEHGDRKGRGGKDKTTGRSGGLGKEEQEAGNIMALVQRVSRGCKGNPGGTVLTRPFVDTVY
jgi:hypothetical protein